MKWNEMKWNGVEWNGMDCMKEWVEHLQECLIIG